MPWMVMTKDEMQLAAAALGQLTIEPAKRLAERLMHEAKLLEDPEEIEQRKVYADLAIDRWHREGEIEIAANPSVSLSEDHGAYVLAWVWVDDPAAPEQFNCGACDKLTNVDESPDGFLFCPKCFESETPE